VFTVLKKMKSIVAIAKFIQESVVAIVNSEASYLVAREVPNMQTPIKLATAGAFDSF